MLLPIDLLSFLQKTVFLYYRHKLKIIFSSNNISKLYIILYIQRPMPMPEKSRAGRPKPNALRLNSRSGPFLWVKLEYGQVEKTLPTGFEMPFPPMWCMESHHTPGAQKENGREGQPVEMGVASRRYAFASRNSSR